MSKGSARRVENRAAVEANWDKVFGPKTTDPTMTDESRALYRKVWKQYHEALRDDLKAGFTYSWRDSR